MMELLLLLASVESIQPLLHSYDELQQWMCLVEESPLLDQGHCLVGVVGVVGVVGAVGAVGVVRAARPRNPLSTASQ